MSDLRIVSRRFVSEFISLYRSNPCLWKIKSREYSDRNMKNVAYEELRVKLLEVDPDATKDKVLKKINSLRTCFRKELNKVYKSEKAAKSPEEIYKPSLWYFEDLTFLIDQEMQSRVISGINSEEFDVEDNSKIGLVSVVDQPEVSISEESSSSPTCRRKKPKVDHLDSVLNLVARRPEDGQFSTYGKHVALELEALPFEMALYCKRVINEAIFEAQMGTLNRTSRVVTDACLSQVDLRRRDLGPSGWFIERKPRTLVPEVHSEHILSHFQK